jgi:hypothetical protein
LGCFGLAGKNFEFHTQCSKQNGSGVFPGFVHESHNTIMSRAGYESDPYEDEAERRRNQSSSDDSHSEDEGAKPKTEQAAADKSAALTEGRRLFVTGVHPSTTNRTTVASFEPRLFINLIYNTICFVQRRFATFSLPRAS